MKPAPTGQNYKFSPLPTKSSIRLLQIRSGPNEPTSCSLEVVDLDNNPEYDCLSYTWGNPLYHGLLPPQNGKEITDKREFSIKCDDQIIIVTENLLEALRQLSRNGLRSTNGPYQYERQSRIWIDAICIHQENIPERNSQVPMMERIYRQAQNVVIWLGPNDQLTELGIKVMQRFASVSEENREFELPEDLEDSEVYRILEIPFCNLQDWLALATFLLRTWFSRVWVLQESFAAKETVVFCGTHVLSWGHISAASKTLTDTGLGRLLAGKVEEVRKADINSTEYVGNTLNNLYIFEDMRENAKSLTLETLLQQSRYFGATNRRDHVYGVLGMWIPSSGDQTASDLIKPDYSLSVPVIYTQASAVSIREMGDLNLLSLVEGSSFRSEEMQTENLPSWVPDYTITPVTEPLRGNPRPGEDEERWNASKGLEWEAPQDLDLPRLPVQGIHVTTITARAATEAEILDEHQEFTLLEMLKDCLESPSTPYKKEGGPMEAFWRTLIKDTFCGEPAGDDAREAFASLFIAWVWQLEVLIRDIKRDTVRTNPKPTPNHEPLEKAFSEAYSKSQSLILDLSSKDELGILPTWDAIRTTISTSDERLPFYDADAITESFRLAYLGRRLFRTKENYLGIGPQSLEEGDEVWVLAGARVPFILRRDGKGDEKWRLVGEAYVHGIMNGEAIEMRGGPGGGKVKRIDIV
ncbi:hypothetical protein EG329_011637 [Mollisiaceae sp. DMI_Dod_QoI]|nr:hypothetical protein EG329_011637 [Helotiales sp. DMI_Dod_QoI]